MGPGILLYAFGPFLLDTRERRLLRDGEVVPLTLKAFDLLQVLVENQGHLLQKEELLRRVWPDAVVEENNLTVTISALRKALDEGPTDRQYIETVPRRGYRFVADFRASPESTKAARGPQERRARALALGAMVLAALAAAGALAWVWKRSTPAAPAVPVRSMAVLPFRSLTNDGEYLGLGMADALITKLGSTRLLLVRSTGAVEKYAVPGLDPVAAGRALQVDAVLEGSIQTAGDRLRTTVRLVRVSDVFGEAGDRDRHLYRSALGGLPRARRSVWPTCLLVHSDFFRVRQSVGLVCHVLPPTAKSKWFRSQAYGSSNSHRRYRH